MDMDENKRREEDLNDLLLLWDQHFLTIVKEFLKHETHGECAKNLHDWKIKKIPRQGTSFTQGQDINCTFSAQFTKSAIHVLTTVFNGRQW